MTATMTDKTTTVRRLLDGLVHGEADTLREVVTDDVLGWSPNLFVESRDALIDAVADRQEALSNVELHIGIVHVFGDTAIVEWHVSADHTGTLSIDEDLNIEATGRRLHLSGATFAEFSDDKVNAFRNYFDDLALLEQALLEL